MFSIKRLKPLLACKQILVDGLTLYTQMVERLPVGRIEQRFEQMNERVLLMYSELVTLCEE